MLFLILLAFLTYVTYHLYRYFSPAPNINPSGKYVLISGCDSGFGTLLAIELDHQGFNVFAGVLNPSNVAELETKLSSRAKIFRLDITNDDDIDAALELVKHNTNTLHALVNNAGIGASGNVDWTSMETMRKVMNVNFFGHVAMTKKFLPLLIAKKDCRVVNICSVAGFFAASGLSAYCASKYALESFSDCLRREMVTWNLRVSIIEPGFMRTPIIQGRAKSFKEFWSKLNVDVQERWGEEFLNEQFVISSENIFIKKAEDPMKVVRALQHAVSNTEPCVRYRPGLQSSLFFYPLSMLPAWFADWFMQKSAHRKLSPAGVARQLQD